MSWLIVLKNWLIKLLMKHEERQQKSKALFSKICVKYYERVQTVKQIQFELRRYSDTDTDDAPLCRANGIIVTRLNYLNLSCLNCGFDLSEVREVFGTSLRDAVNNLDDLFVLLDRCGREPNRFHLMDRKGSVALCANIICEWDGIVNQVAKSMGMKVEDLKQDIHDRYLPL